VIFQSPVDQEEWEGEGGHLFGKWAVHWSQKSLIAKTFDEGDNPFAGASSELSGHPCCDGY
jgi:hypothetical protein